MTLLALLAPAALSSRRSYRRAGTGTAPSFITAPSIIGTPTEGSPVSVTAATVAGSPTPTIALQWLLDGANISGATNLTYTPVTVDVGHQLSRRETATNVNGTANITSAAVTVSAAGGFSTVPLPSGPASTGANPIAWDAQAAATGWLVYLSASPQTFPDHTLYSYVYYVSSGATLSLALTGVQAGAWYCRVAAIEGAERGDLSNEFPVVTA